MLVQAIGIRGRGTIGRLCHRFLRANTLLGEEVPKRRDL